MSWISVLNYSVTLNSGFEGRWMDFFEREPYNWPIFTDVKYYEKWVRRENVGAPLCKRVCRITRIGALPRAVYAEWNDSMNGGNPALCPEQCLDNGNYRYFFVIEYVVHHGENMDKESLTG